MPNTAAPNWYPDPKGEAEFRWWDGTQWTEYIYSSPRQPLNSPQLPSSGYGTPAEVAYAPVSNTKPGRKKAWLLGGAGATLAALAVVAGLTLPGMLGGGSSQSGETAQSVGSVEEETFEPVIANGYKYLPPIELDIAERNPNRYNDESLHFDANISLEDLAVQIGSGDIYSATGILDLYADRELTVPIDTSAFGGDCEEICDWSVKPLQALPEALLDDDVPLADGETYRVFYDEELAWSQYAEY